MTVKEMGVGSGGGGVGSAGTAPGPMDIYRGPGVMHYGIKSRVVSFS